MWVLTLVILGDFDWNIWNNFVLACGSAGNSSSVICGRHHDQAVTAVFASLLESPLLQRSSKNTRTFMNFHPQVLRSSVLAWPLFGEALICKSSKTTTRAMLPEERSNCVCLGGWIYGAQVSQKIQNDCTSHVSCLQSIHASSISVLVCFSISFSLASTKHSAKHLISPVLWTAAEDLSDWPIDPHGPAV